MAGLDWALVVIYLCGLIGLSYTLGKGQADHRDYYLGGAPSAGAVWESQPWRRN